MEEIEILENDIRKLIETLNEKCEQKNLSSRYSLHKYFNNVYDVTENNCNHFDERNKEVKKDADYWERYYGRV